MRKRFAIGLVISSLLTFSFGTSTLAAPDRSGFDTAKAPYLVASAPGVLVDAILSTGDIVPGTNYQMSGIPDGLGAYRADRADGSGDRNSTGGRRNVVVVMNHELGKSFPGQPVGVDSRISRIEIDPKTRKVQAAEYLFNGTEGFERFCSSTLIIVDKQPWYLTGEESIPPPGTLQDGSSIVMNPDTGAWTETEHFGHLQHENVVPVELSDWVFLTSEDDFRAGQPSYLYAYIADTFEGAVSGEEGGLYVWRADNLATNQNSTVLKNVPVPGQFVPISQVPENATSASLKTAAGFHQGFRFDRLEDIAVRPDVEGRVYIADTGKPATQRGRIYQFDIDPNDPTRATLTMILNGEAPDSDDIFNPDNMDASERVLVIQEDRESPHRTGFNRVLTYDFQTKVIREVAHVATPNTLTPGTWESSGVIDAGYLLGRDWWLLDVQAHSTFVTQPGLDRTFNSGTGEDGQLLAIYIPGSQGNRDNDDD